MSKYYDDTPSSSKKDNGEDKWSDSGYAASLKDLEPDAVAMDGELSIRGAKAKASSHRRSPSATAKKQAESQVHQMKYNDNRVALGRCITQSSRILKDLQSFNRDHDIYYPAVEDEKKNESKQVKDKKGKQKDMVAAMMDADEEEEEKNNEPLPPMEQAPRLMTPQLKKNFNVFKINLKMDSSPTEELVHQLSTGHFKTLLDQKVQQMMRHLENLRDRIDDITSKVLITGDLNSGKSTFCNALLRRKLLPADQQPCTNVFCEVKDARENGGNEQVHAVLKGQTYDIHNKESYEIWKLDDLDDLVSEVEKYSILKVYVDDNRPIHQSLLRNGIVDISLIDAPGLNLDSYQTTEVFSRQEEIDLVVFVVSAENHFTLSAKEFITTAANEKSFIFIVVNRFDNIKNKDKCKTRIMDQVADLSPATHKDASDFVHFVSSDGVLNDMPGGGGGGGDDDGDDEPNLTDPDFDNLEQKLRNFVLEKRSLSKLAPAKTYLANILQDLGSLAEVNLQVTKTEYDSFIGELDQIAPQFDKAKKSKTDLANQIEKDIEETSADIYNFTTSSIKDVVDSIGEYPVVAFDNLSNIFEYAETTKKELVRIIQDTVGLAEDYAREKTSKQVNIFKQLGIQHLGDNYNELIFHPDRMFTKGKSKKLLASRIDVTPADFFDLQLPQLPIVALPWVTDKINKVDSKELVYAGNFLTLGSMYAGWGALRDTRAALEVMRWVDFGLLKKIIIPTAVIATGIAAYYVVSDIPNAIPRKLSKKVRNEVESMNFMHYNGDRIASKVRAALRRPAEQLKQEFQHEIDDQFLKKQEYEQKANEAEYSYTFFKKLLQRTSEERAAVEQCNLSVD